MTDTGEEREAESTHLEEPVEEVRISEGAQQLADEAAAEPADVNENQLNPSPMNQSRRSTRRRRRRS